MSASVSCGLSGDELAQEAEYIRTLEAERRASLKPLALHFLARLQERGTTPADSETWARKMVTAWADARVSLDRARNTYALAAVRDGGGRAAAVEEFQGLLRAGAERAAPERGGAAADPEALSMAARLAADYFSALPEVVLSVRHVPEWIDDFDLEGILEPEELNDRDRRAEALVALVAAPAARAAEKKRLREEEEAKRRKESPETLSDDDDDILVLGNLDAPAAAAAAAPPSPSTSSAARMPAYQRTSFAGTPAGGGSGGASGGGRSGALAGMARVERAFAWKLAQRHPSWPAQRSARAARAYASALAEAGLTYSRLLKTYCERRELLGPEDDLVEWRKEMFKVVFNR